jgi:Tetracyclin repressor-like, C-terminal domain
MSGSSIPQSPPIRCLLDGFLRSQYHRAAVVNMVERSWTFMLEHTQLYRLVNGMDGVPIDKTVVGRSAQSLCRVVAEAVRPLLGGNAAEADGQLLADELWALLHGMSALYMDRVAPFDLVRVTNAVMTLIQGTRMRLGARARRQSIK